MKCTNALGDTTKSELLHSSEEQEKVNNLEQ